MAAGSTKEHLYFALLPVELRSYVDVLLAHHYKSSFELLGKPASYIGSREEPSILTSAYHFNAPR